jgi:hypothetical protein
MRNHLWHLGVPLLGLALLAPTAASAGHYGARSHYSEGWGAHAPPPHYRSSSRWGRPMYYAAPVQYHYRDSFRGHDRGYYPRHIAPAPYYWQPHRVRYDRIYRQPYGRAHHLPRSSLDVTVRYRIRH